MDWQTPRGHRYTVTHHNTAQPSHLERQLAAAITGHTTPGKLRF
jgi:hypothetical protein